MANMVSTLACATVSSTNGTALPAWKIKRKQNRIKIEKPKGKVCQSDAHKYIV